MRVIVRNVKKPRATEQTGKIRSRERFDVSSFSTPLYATWGMVLKAYSSTNTVDLKLHNGLELREVDVRSLEWAGADSIGYGERDLPPEGCRVLVVFPEGIIENAFVLCSALDVLGKVGEKQKAELLVSGKETEHLRVRTGKKTIIKINGVTLTVNVDGSIEIQPASGKDIKLAGGTTIGANDLVSCIFSGAAHCTDPDKKVKVP
jgi:hypothetical protein